MRIITEVDHFNICAKRAVAGFGTFAKPGESQDKAIKRFVSGRKREWSHQQSRKFPTYKPGMSTAEYVRAYEATSPSQPGLKCSGFWDDLNLEPATLYEGGAVDFAPVCELAESEPVADTVQDLPAPVEAAPVPDCAPVVVAAPVAATLDIIAPAILAARPTATYATKTRKIGSHEWVTVVYAHDLYTACTDHLWRRVGDPGRFRVARDWPTYDSNRTHSGLPLTIGKLYAEHETSIRSALDDLRALRVPEWCGQVTIDTARRGLDWEAKRAAQIEALKPSTPQPAPAPAETAPLPDATGAIGIAYPSLDVDALPLSQAGRAAPQASPPSGGSLKHPPAEAGVPPGVQMRQPDKPSALPESGAVHVPQSDRWRAARAGLMLRRWRHWRGAAPPPVESAHIPPAEAGPGCTPWRAKDTMRWGLGIRPSSGGSLALRQVRARQGCGPPLAWPSSPRPTHQFT